MKKIKILHILRSDLYAGAESIAVNIIKELSEKYEFIYACPRGSIVTILNQYHITYMPMKCFSIGEVKRVIDLVKPDIIHAHDYSASILSAVVSHGRSVLISHLHHNSPECKTWGRKALLYTAVLTYIDTIIAVSDAVVAGMVFEKFAENKIIVVENPVDKKRIRKLAEATVSGKYDMVFVGRLSVKKNPIRFIEIVRLLCAKGLDIKAAMLGNGELYEQCKKEIEKHQLEDTISLLGFRENPYPYMKNAKIFCMTSIEEGYGLAVMESVVLETPVLVTPVGKMAEFFQDKEEICVSDQEFCQKAEMLLTNEDIYCEWKEKTRGYTGMISEVDAYIEKVDKIYGGGFPN